MEQEISGKLLNIKGRGIKSFHLKSNVACRVSSKDVQGKKEFSMFELIIRIL